MPATDFRCPRCRGPVKFATFRIGQMGCPDRIMEAWQCQDCNYLPRTEELVGAQELELTTLERHLTGALRSIWRLLGKKRDIVSG